MGKLVLLLEDGTTQDILLRRERITIGRRPDNDVCLPHPAVSGEHAAVTTILSDSFLEDLGSTNGTAVNGGAVQKHFLRDGDLVEIGRQRLVYMVDEQAHPTGAIRPRPEAHSGPETVPNLAPSPRAAAEASAAEPATEAPPAGARGSHGTKPRRHEEHGVGMIVDDPPTPFARSARGSGHGEARAELVVLTGPRAGRCLPLVKEVTSVGRAGVQVALVRRTPDGYLLTAAEGSAPPEVNGVAVGGSGMLLGPGDVIVIAGARVEFSAPPDLPT